MRGTTGRKPCQSLLPNRDQRCYYHNRFLKPGALGRLRDFKLSARSRIFDSHAQIPISELLTSHSSSTSTSSSSDQIDPAMNQINFGVPCFALRINSPRCLLRKKLFAVAPVFAESIQRLSVIS
ncbi:uncharacterized protein LOC114714630 [Neltuma alba]|uniref:uncharacterized protein LOC114714630 n=1 Tax=Neltuma alba TaxID=207710 RepID=UPI0010A348B3|nr:uncharacterized protein LOC114714630 [Prosopis alba]